MLVASVEAGQTHDLRRRVLRDGRPENLVFPEDDRPGAFHLGVRETPGGPLLAVASFSPEESAHRPGRSAVRLRGMATEQTRQGQGIGRRLLEEAVDRLRHDGVEVLWGNARDSALSFYRRLGFEVLGPGFLAGPAGDIPHHVVLLDL
ncbi:MAG: GNAT family N-acetyltransferase [Actinomycetota bacterium]|nr:GNAT family N-acetyltransferase [Actinomycetota bacterium]